MSVMVFESQFYTPIPVFTVAVAFMEILFMDTCIYLYFITFCGISVPKI